MNESTGPDPAAVPESIAPPTLEAIETLASTPTPDSLPWKRWIRYIWSTNPFYLMSAALLLYGVYLVSNETKVFTRETAQLAFNFGALQFYGVLLVGTAILLARRPIWYDSTLLVALENALVLIPFILVTQAALIEQRFVWSYCAAGLVLATLRFAALRRWFAQLNLPARALGCGAIVLAVNAALPVIFRHLHESKFGTKLAEGAAYEFNVWSWLVVLPVLIVLANLLPSPLADDQTARPADSDCPRRPWLPMMFYGFWIAASVTHLYSLGYVYDFDLQRAWIAPALLAFAWTLYHRITDFVESPGWNLDRALLIVPAAIPFVAGLAGNKITFTLAAINAVAYLLQQVGGTQPRLGFKLTIASGLTMVAAIPHSWGAMVIPEFNPTKAVAAAALAALILPALFSRNPKLGFFGALAVAAGVGAFVGPAARGGNWAMQAGCVFFLLHSLRWVDTNEKGLAIARWIIGTCWVMHSYIWAHLGGPGWGIAIAGALVLGSWQLVRQLGWVHGLRAMGIMAGLVVVSSPLDAAGRWMVAAPAGLLAVAGSLLLFAIGTATALNKHRWHTAE